MIRKDWVREAAEEIREAFASMPWEPELVDVDECAVIIAKHSPLKDGVAYMPVPRCETCRHATELPSYWIHCRQLQIEAPPDFGCVQWETKR